MHVIAAAEAPRFELPGVELTGYAAPSSGSAQICAWQIKVAPGLISDQAHTLDRDEIFLVTSGTIQLSKDGRKLSAGDCAIVPAATPIQLINPGAEPATAHVAVQAGFSARMADGTTLDTPPWAR